MRGRRDGTRDGKQRLKHVQQECLAGAGGETEEDPGGLAGLLAAQDFLEGGSDQITEEVAVDAIFFAHQAAQPVLDLIEKIRAAVGNTKREFVPPPKDEVLRIDKTVLYRYRPMVEKPAPVPVLLTYALVGRYTMMDLQEDRSLVRNLLRAGLDVYIVDWGHPSRADRFAGLDDDPDGRTRQMPAINLEALGLTAEDDPGAITHIGPPAAPAHASKNAISRAPPSNSS